MSKTFYIFRHGLATHSTTGYGDKIFTAEVLPEGYPPIKKMGQWLADKPCQAFWSSPIIRCQQTSQTVSDATGQKFGFDERIGEYYPKVELWENVKKRGQDFVNFINETYGDDDHIWICTHGALIAVLKHLIVSGEVTIEQELDFPPTGTLVLIKDGKVEIKDFND